MYLNLNIINSEYAANGLDIIQHYQIYDTDFTKDFTIIYNCDNVINLNEVLYNIYSAYRSSNQPLCKNFKIVLNKTFSSPTTLDLIKTTNFYKNHKKLLCTILER